MIEINFTQKLILNTLKLFLFRVSMNVKITSNRKTRLLTLILVACLGSYQMTAQSCGTIYLMNGFDGEVKSMNTTTGVLTNITVGGAPLKTGGNHENLAVGPNPSNTASIVFTSSTTPSGSTVYQNDVTTGVTTLAAFGGLTANPATTGATAGYVYGISSTKNLIQVVPTALNLGTISGDAIFTGGTISNDAFFDNAGNIYTIITNGANYYIYSINVASRIAYQVKQITGMPASFNFQGIAYNSSNNSLYVCQGFSSTILLLSWANAKIYRINMATGAATFVADQQLNTFVGPFSTADALDLASCDIYSAPTAAFSFNCGTATLQSGTFLTNGIAGQAGVLRIPVSSVTTAGNATFTISSSAAGFLANPTSYTAFVTNGATYIDIPITYDGSGSAGTRTLTVTSAQGTGVCTKDVTVTAPPTSFTYPFNCTGSTVSGTFIANAITGQTGTVTVPIGIIQAGSATFTVTGTNFSGTLTTSLISGQSSVTIPITYTGAGTEGSRLLTITSAPGTGTCTVSVPIQSTCKASGGRIGQ